MFASDSYKPKRTDGLPKLPRLWNHSSSTRKYSHEEIQKYSKAYDVVLPFGKNIYILRLGPWTVYAIKPLWWHFRRKIISFSAAGVPRVMDSSRGKKTLPWIPNHQTHHHRHVWDDYEGKATMVLSHKALYMLKSSEGPLGRLKVMQPMQTHWQEI